jgi:dephospho-CoA kinase
MLRIGLTGGVASGKSTVSQVLRELGAVVIDADALAREVVERGTPGLAAVVEEFGPGLLTPDGDLDRAAMGRLVFGDGQDAKDARRRLEGIIHPLVYERITELEAEAPADAVVVHDIPLLTENSRSGDFDAVIVVDVPEEMQVERMVRDAWVDRGRRPLPDRGAGHARAAARDRHLCRGQHRDTRGPPPSGGRGPRGAEGLAGQAARSGSAILRSLAIASRSSWRTRSAEMPWRAPMSASLCCRPSTRP